MIVGREKDKTPIIFADVTSGTCDRLEYRKARKIAEGLPLANLEAFMQGYDSARKEKPKFIRGLLNICEYLSPDMTLLAYRDVLGERTQGETQ